MVNIDVPTAIAAVLVSISLSLVKDNITDILQARIASTTEQYEEKIEWLRETQALAEQVEGLVISLQGESSGVNSIKSNVKKQIQDITLEDVNSLDDFHDELSKVDGITYEETEYELPEKYLFEDIFDEVKKQTIENLMGDETEAEADLSNRINSEMYEHFKKLNEHYSHRTLTLDDELWSAYMDLRHRCYGIKHLDKIQESDVEEIEELVEEVIREAQKEKEQLFEEKRLRNRVKSWCRDLV